MISEMQRDLMIHRCAEAILFRSAHVTASLPRPRPRDFPRGELLSIGTNGSHNYSVCPIKLIAWLARQGAAK